MWTKYWILNRFKCICKILWLFILYKEPWWQIWKENDRYSHKAIVTKTTTITILVQTKKSGAEVSQLSI